MALARATARFAWIAILGGPVLAGVAPGAIRILGLAIWGLGVVSQLSAATYLLRAFYPAVETAPGPAASYN